MFREMNNSLHGEVLPHIIPVDLEPRRPPWAGASASQEHGSSPAKTGQERLLSPLGSKNGCARDSGAHPAAFASNSRPAQA